MSRLKLTVDLGYTTEARGRIPAYNSVEEEAAFWDSHDATEFVGQELRPVALTVSADLAERLTIRLDRTDRERLVRQAKSKGIGPSTLARMWLKERLRQEVETEAQAP